MASSSEVKSAAKAKKAGARAKGLLLEGVPYDRIVRAAKAKRDLERLMRASASWDKEGR